MPAMEDEAPTPEDVTALLRAYRAGDRAAFDQLVPLVYQDLRRLARRQMRRTPLARTLDTTGLVHEAWMKLADQPGTAFQDRGHFLAVAARAMRQVVIDYARRKLARKRGAGAAPVELKDDHASVQDHAEWLLMVDQALTRLGGVSARLVQVVECRYFAGLSEEETAEALGVSLRTAQREWLRARAWLRESLGPQP
jgi:RNA polymerase sigma factor (TIGR02999 family)